ncbi:hypothetical protein [Alteraurantiacibacter palmitatis]|uniref:Uncharacterized protein n=1 Tax=Alteraurantiacibacter palmitatis TaxID=2054628 RepID=A0ABV7E602_9SPHN
MSATMTISLNRQPVTVPMPGAMAAQVAQASSIRAQAWAVGTEPGGPGTLSAREWSEEAQIAASAADASVAAVAAAAAGLNKLSDIITWHDGLPRHQVAWQTDIGRATMLPNGNWSFVSAVTEERWIYANGQKVAPIIQVAGEFKSAPFHDTIPSSGQPGFVTNSNTGGTALTQYATQHSSPDRFGGTGGCLRLVQATTTQSAAQRRFNDQTVDAVAEDIVRVVAHVSFNANPTGTGSYLLGVRAISGSAPGGTMTFGFNTSGEFISTTPASQVLRGGYEPLEVRDGKQWWLIWADMRCTATGTIAGYLREPQTPVGADIAVQDFYITKNPLGRASGVPVCRANANYAADRLGLGSASQFLEVHFWENGRGVSRAAGHQVSLPAVQLDGNRYSVAGSVFNTESRIDVYAAKTAANHNFLLPHRYPERDFKGLGGATYQNLTFRALGHWDHKLRIETGSSNLDIRGLSDTDYLRLPWIGLNTSKSFTQNFHFNGVMFSAGSAATSQFGQNEIPQNQQGQIAYGGAFTSDIMGMASHPYEYSRLRNKVPYGEGLKNNAATYVGNFPRDTNSNSQLFQVNNMFTFGVAKPLGLSNCVANIGGLVQANISGDFMGWGSGLSGEIRDWLAIRDNVIRADFYQSAPDMPLWLDYGAGWVSVETAAASAGMTVANFVRTLPVHHRWERYGQLSRPYDANNPRTLADLQYDPKPDEWTAVIEWQIKGATFNSADKPGYQCHRTYRRLPDPAAPLGYVLTASVPYDSAWISTGYKQAAPDNPHLLWVRGNGRYRSSDGAWTPIDGASEGPAYPNTFTHGDLSQINVSSTTLNITVRRGLANVRAQGFFGQGPQNDPTRVRNVTIENYFLANQTQNAVRYDNMSGGTITLRNFVLAKSIEEDKPDSGANRPWLLQSQNAPSYVLDNAVLTAMVQADGAILSPVVQDGSPPNPIPPSAYRRVLASQYDETTKTWSTVTPTVVNGSVTEPTWAQLLGRNSPIYDPRSGWINQENEVEAMARWVFPPNAVRYLGWNPNQAIDNTLRSRITYITTYNFITEVLQALPIGHGTIANNQAAGTEVPIYEDFDDGKQKIVRLPGFTIDPMWSGYGIDTPFTITPDGKFVQRWASLSSLNKVLPFLTRSPDGQFGPVVTIDVTA